MKNKKSNFPDMMSLRIANSQDALEISEPTLKSSKELSFLIGLRDGRSSEEQVFKGNLLGKLTDGLETWPHIKLAFSCP